MNVGAVPVSRGEATKTRGKHPGFLIIKHLDFIKLCILSQNCSSESILNPIVAELQQ